MKTIAIFTRDSNFLSEGNSITYYFYTEDEYESDNSTRTININITASKTE